MPPKKKPAKKRAPAKKKRAPTKKRAVPPAQSQRLVGTTGQAYVVPMSGEGFLQDVNKFLKKHKVISKGATFLGDVGILPHGKTIGKVASMAGYGHPGSGLRVPGGALMVPGQTVRTRRPRRVAPRQKKR